jgi:hypothetical protein
METMDGGAFGSFVAAVNVANTAIGSVGYRIVRASRIKLFQDPTRSTHQSTQVPERGIVELKCGMELNAVKLSPSEVAIRVMQVSDGFVWTGEIVGERLGQCIGFVIRWKRTLLRILEGRPVSIGEPSEGQNFSFPALVVLEHEFEEGDTSINYNNGLPHLHGDSGSARNTSPLTEGSHCSTCNVPVVDGLPAERQ